MDQLHLDVEVTRGAQVESRHRVHAAVVDASGRRVASARDAGTVTHWRSCAKPFQVMPLLEDGGFDALGWGDDELALACASHGGEPEHVAIAQAMLESIGREEGDLACGAHEPFAQRGQAALRASATRATRLHNNCSGKHAAMLGRAHVAGWPSLGYERREHPVQQGCLAEVARWSDVAPKDIGLAVDGCGVVVFALPLQAMALAFARLGQASRDAGSVPARVVHAMRSRPFLVGGSDRFDTALIEATDGRVLPKVGAEGVYSLSLVSEGIGVALKAEDGAQRAQIMAVLRVLQLLGALPAELPPRLVEFASPLVRNTRGEVVGEVRCGR